MSIIFSLSCTCSEETKYIYHTIPCYFLVHRLSQTTSELWLQHSCDTGQNRTFLKYRTTKSYGLYSLFNVSAVGHMVVQLVEALPYKLEGRGFDSQWSYWDFSLT